MKIHLLVFSYNRAKQCDHLLRSIQQHLAGLPVDISVVWHATGAHHEGYSRCEAYTNPPVCDLPRAPEDPPFSAMYFRTCSGRATFSTGAS